MALLAATLVAVSSACAAQGLGADKNLQSRSTVYSVNSSDAGVGADQQYVVAKAVKLIQQGQLAGADTLLDEVLGHFAGLMTDGKQTYVSMRDDAEYQQFVQERQAPGGNPQVTRLHHAFAQALQMKAYIASSRQQWEQAVTYLDKKMSYAPYEAQPYLEKGYILNAQGKPQEGLEVYEKGYRLALTHGGTAQEQAAALRGMGSAEIDLGKLDKAAVSFRMSLQIEPGNKTALGELDYIQKLKAKGQ